MNPFTSNKNHLNILIGLSYVVMLCFIIPLLPTHDDWTGTIAPHQGDLLKLLCPRYSYWRPMEGFIGWIGGLFPQSYPSLPHIIVVTAHYLNALMVYKIAKLLNFKKEASVMGCLVFLFAPAMLSDVTAPDGLAQNLASLFGLLATYYYIKTDGLKQYPLGNYTAWVVILLLATFAKENGILWGAIAPVIMWGAKRITGKKMILTWAIPIVLGVVYLLVRSCLPQDNVDVEDDYFEFSLSRTVINTAKLIANAFLCVDWISLLHAPSRNMVWGGLSVLLSTPFLAIVLFKGKKKSRLLASLVVAFFISECMHIVTIFSLMHVYASLAVVALILIYLLNDIEYTPRLHYTFLSYMLVALIVFVHTNICAYNSGLTGRKMAEEAIKATPRPADKVKILAIEDDFPKLSSYCVIPYDAFGWGEAARYATGYKWPKEIDDTIVSQTEKSKLPAMANAAYKEGFDCVWVVEHDSIYRIKP